VSRLLTNPSDHAKNWTSFDTDFKRHLRGLGETRILHVRYTVPDREVITTELNPKWVSPTEVSSASSGSSVTAEGKMPSVRVDPMAAPQYLQISRWVKEENVETTSPSLDKAGSMKTVS
jgi:hypothetical protein